jgi:hypothetical protein
MVPRKLIFKKKNSRKGELKLKIDTAKLFMLCNVSKRERAKT